MPLAKGFETCPRVPDGIFGVQVGGEIPGQARVDATPGVLHIEVARDPIAGFHSAGRRLRCRSSQWLDADAPVEAAAARPRDMGREERIGSARTGLSRLEAARGTT